MPKQRIDSLLTERGLAGSRTSAAESVRAGRVRLGPDGPLALKPSQLVAADTELTMVELPPFVSRAGIKLANALEALAIDVDGRSCLDVGASTGGFTDCLLKRGARRVVALDVARGQLDWGLRNDRRVTVLEGFNARAAQRRRPSLCADAGDDRRLLHLARRRCCPAIAACVAAGGELLAMVKPQFELGRGRVRGGVVRDAGERREAIAAVGEAAEAAGLAIRGFASSGLPGPKGNRETFIHLGREGESIAGVAAAIEAVDALSIATVAVLTHTQPAQTAAALAKALVAAEEAGCHLYASDAERSKQGELGERLLPAAELEGEPDLCLVLGGDGTILTALRTYAGTTVPVFAVNYGTVGFLAAVEAAELDAGLAAAFAGAFEVISMPGLEASGIAGSPALNDISLIRRHQGRVAELAYSLEGKEVGHVRCDGLVAATPAGSTGYNLANQGPILAWGVKGYVVSFIAPHTLTARPLVVAPDDVLSVTNIAGRDPVEVVLDGEHVDELASGAEMEIRFRDGAAHLAQLAGANFYRRIRDKFGRLAH